MHYEPLEQALPESTTAPVRDEVARKIVDRFSVRRHGDLPKLLASLELLPELQATRVALDQDVVRLGSPSDCSPTLRAGLERGLRELGPWRKGPFEVMGVHVDAEWRSDIKWRRVAPYLLPLAGRTVLDVGCGNGYYALRMLGSGAARVVGVEPSPRFVLQFEALTRLMPPLPASVLPLRIEDLPRGVADFDSVFSMGVLYHRRSAAEHLGELFERLAVGGQLVLETLTLAEGSEGVLVPEGRYANMRNVWAVPSPRTLLDWVSGAGFQDVRLVASAKTTAEEQRATSWMPLHSLEQALSPDDESITVEGYPAPRRAVVVAIKP